MRRWCPDEKEDEEEAETEDGGGEEQERWRLCLAEARRILGEPASGNDSGVAPPVHAAAGAAMLREANAHSWSALDDARLLEVVAREGCATV